MIPGGGAKVSTNLDEWLRQIKAIEREHSIVFPRIAASSRFAYDRSQEGVPPMTDEALAANYLDRILSPLG